MVKKQQMWDTVVANAYPKILWKTYIFTKKKYYFGSKTQQISTVSTITLNKPLFISSPPHDRKHPPCSTVLELNQTSDLNVTKQCNEYDLCLTSNHANIEQSKKSHWLPPRAAGWWVTSQDRKRIISTVRFNCSAAAFDRSLKYKDETNLDLSVENLYTSTMF